MSNKEEGDRTTKKTEKDDKDLPTACLLRRWRQVQYKRIYWRIDDSTKQRLSAYYYQND